MLPYPSLLRLVSFPSFAVAAFSFAAGLHGTAQAAATNDWAAYLGDPGGSHYSTLDQITPANVTQLQPAWSFQAGGASPNNRSQIQTNPLIVDGVLYGTSPDLQLFALDAATGRELWRFNPADGSGNSGPAGVNRGLTWWQEGAERRLLFSAGRFLFAINPQNGQPYPDFGDAGRVDLLRQLDVDDTLFAGRYLAANTPGVVYRDTIILGMRVGEGPAPSVPGHIRAFDVRTGKRRWIFHTIPHPGEFGHDTWPADAWQRVGGANCWAGMAIDLERGLVFVPTGSAAFDFYGADRVGSNLFANSLIALDAATGERRWHFQFVHHDVWDRDPPAAPVLCEVMHQGRKVAAVVQVLKSGHVWVFNRETGESLFPWEEMPAPATDLPGEQTWPTQPMPLKPAPFARQIFAENNVTDRTPAARAAVLQRLRELRPHQPWDPPSERGTVIYPGFDGGAEWGGPAVDPRGILFVNSNEMAWILQMVPTATISGASSSAKTVYTQLCMSCHGANREGNAAANIPKLIDVGSRLTRDQVMALVRGGKGMMPSFNFLPDASKQALVDYLMDPARFEQQATTRVEHAGVVETAPANAAPYVTTGYNRFLDPDGYPAVKPPWGTLNAINLNTGEYLWRVPLGELPELTAQGIPPTGTENYGGPVVTASGLLFIAATKDEKFRAFDTRTGKVLWETTLPAGGYATPATYAVNGRQYVVIACGGGKMGTKSGDTYLAFALPEP